MLLSCRHAERILREPFVLWRRGDFFYVVMWLVTFNIPRLMSLARLATVISSCTAACAHAYVW